MAIARKLLVVIWHVLTKQTTDQKIDEVQVDRKLVTWAYKLRKAGRCGLGEMVFVRGRLQALKVGRELTEISWGGRILNLHPPALELVEELTAPVAV